MSRLSNSLKALINAPAARPNTVPAPRDMKAVYAKIQQSAQANGLSQPSWVALSAATTITMNSPESLTILYDLATTTTTTTTTTTAPSQTPNSALATAELIREVSLKCISFNGIPRTINSLNAFRASLPDSITTHLTTTPTREPTPANIETIKTRGRALWDSVYRPFESKLYNRLAAAHPDLPVHILNANYGAILSDPVDVERAPGQQVGRVLTSLVAVACLRAQTGVGPQVMSHVFGLRKAVEDGSWVGDNESVGGRAAAEWLASEEGNVWILESVDAIVGAIGGVGGSNFAAAGARLHSGTVHQSAGHL
ncbi:uncharacterized protein BO97DRAFT_477446 [Aspergillus homomorphus CBS 101889]|uniref:Uncharacterized protein n=1 Tax=Aspergillus homomorphus (strain CBS 101889) TaxID=1450537 RepID=A0A395HZJ5_ASPHC|nr:hypothetical protein BO97DRAFT_477446 [Aspergillus homomorphus CBS 101889]RAL13220.1 hypothetical protein BO97DRAFT_477446 [Aspergillus homomorphus CBS 101889]